MGLYRKAIFSMQCQLIYAIVIVIINVMLKRSQNGFCLPSVLINICWTGQAHRYMPYDKSPNWLALRKIGQDFWPIIIIAGAAAIIILAVYLLIAESISATMKNKGHQRVNFLLH